MALDPATARRVAKLARIGLNDQELETVRVQMGSILDWIGMLDEVDVENVPPMTGTEHVTLRQREDVVTDGGRAEDILSNAPDRAGAFFTVPKVVE
ncbi:Asp-tRNA(Asn)/Glu-tRNA(Gln) amidotransferase subunit GatC [Acetobacter sp. AN02]|uniref:Asp-tRNA(Asn)/Glu-tRNA(Gln) amidotransferase subunit GatC n=1 Tax=Acetobacter sp. AN02 TaxID=2894186 RepID=UPI0024346232|nr:Asp-tRNA(Asn)/Glu-tRNA(Gln) amidotransferase subunit GatC [Acetobacter sp. AN02]MDG6095627.1 Asp-tRNA(Asn)/Glu-tRNA(Gln) amidotransferase subunit GatC [Acetobacter sp. AN02]